MIRHVLVSAAAAVAFLVAAAAPAGAAQPYPVSFHTFDLSLGTTSGLTYANGSLALAASGLGTFDYSDPYANAAGDGVDGSGTYQFGTWTSAPYAVGFAFNELVSSWNATTPVGTWLQAEVQPQLADGHWAKWYILGRWTSSDSDFHRTSPSTPSSRRIILRPRIASG
jgi:hypothetical protein